MRRHLLKKREESDPMGVVSNLFDVAMVFAVALMVALVTRYSMTEMFSQEDFTIVKNPGKEDMEIITKEGGKVNRYTPSEDQSSKSGAKGRRVGIAYELENAPFCNSPSRLGLIVGDCKAHLLSRWKEKVSTSNGYRSSMAIRRPLHEKVNCRTEPRNSACLTDCRSGMRTAGEGGLSPVFASRAAEPHPASVYNLPYRAA